MSKNNENKTQNITPADYSSGRDILNPLLFGIIAVVIMAVISKLMGV